MTAQKITLSLKQATAAYIAAKAKTETVRPLVESLKSEVLSTFDFQYSEEWNDISTGKITKISDVYMMSDEDFTIYADLMHAAYLTAGFEVSPDHCPLLMAENEERKAGIAMVNAAKYITNCEYDNLLSRIDLIPKFLDTLVKLVLSA